MSVKVGKHPKTGLVVTPSETAPGWGTIRVDSTQITIENGIANENNRSAFIRAKLDLFTKMGVKEGLVLKGQIVKSESYQPFYENQQPKKYPDGAIVNGENVGGQVCLTNGRETFLKYDYTEDMSAFDKGLDYFEQNAQEQVAEETASQTA